MQRSRRGQLPCLADERSEDFIVDEADLHANPALDSDIRRLEIDLRRFGDHHCLMACWNRNPDRDAAVVVVVVGEHDEDLLADEKRRFAMRKLFAGVGQRQSQPAHALDVVFGSENSRAHAFSNLA